MRFLRSALVYISKHKLDGKREIHRMRYVTSIERLAKQEGKVESARENIIIVLEVRFGEIPLNICESVNLINDLSVLKKLHRNAILISSVEDFAELINEISL
jgi:hypothetical protein